MIVDSTSLPAIIQIAIKQSKTDPFHQGFILFLGSTDTSVCPVTALLPYLSLRGNTPEHLFVLDCILVIFWRTCWINIIYQHTTLNTHSFQIRAASSTRAANIPDHQIQMLGRRKSNTYKLYLRTFPTDLFKAGCFSLLFRSLMSAYKLL